MSALPAQPFINVLQILVVEDEPDTATTTAFILRAQGHKVEVAYDGKTALQLVVTNPPDVVLLDLGLPDMDGFDVTRQLRQMPLLRRPTVIAVTGFGMQQERQRSYNAGVDLHLTKPVDIEEMLRILTRLSEMLPAKNK